uniref:Uncharacterized protein n=1 Tax=Spongospora subterranea TaxID=70186 RepID=A0A0H5RQ28_9EUKA|eukprot:CRZ10799.1 hypothetical protein [Spongospora subterranea]
MTTPPHPVEPLIAVIKPSWGKRAVFIGTVIGLTMAIIAVFGGFRASKHLKFAEKFRHDAADFENDFIKYAAVRPTKEQCAKFRVKFNEFNELYHDRIHSGVSESMINLNDAMVKYHISIGMIYDNRVQLTQDIHIFGESCTKTQQTDFHLRLHETEELERCSLHLPQHYLDAIQRFESVWANHVAKNAKQFKEVLKDLEVFERDHVHGEETWSWTQGWDLLMTDPRLSVLVPCQILKIMIRIEKIFNHQLDTSQ